MPLRLVAVRFDTHDPSALAAFWAGLLRREIVGEESGTLLPGVGTQIGLRFVASPTAKLGLNCLHLHLTSSTLDDQRRTVETSLALGGRHLDVGQSPEEDHVVLADPAGNAFCVIEPGNQFLANCGFLGEVSCDGSREVGLFWRDAFGWPLVWDRDGETAVQSPRGGTKISWGGPREAPKIGSNRQRFELAAPNLAAEVERLVSLGAAELGDRDGGVELADPDGNEFWVHPS